MSWKKIAIAFVFADFTALTAYIVAQVGYVGFFEQAVSSLVGVQVLIDLVIALSLFLVWMVRDAREHGISPVPFVVLTLFLGSIGALAYLLRRPEEAPATAPHLASAS